MGSEGTARSLMRTNVNSATRPQGVLRFGLGFRFFFGLWVLRAPLRVPFSDFHKVPNGRVLGLLPGLLGLTLLGLGL